MALIFVTTGVNLGTANTTMTITHGLGLAPDFTTIIPTRTALVSTGSSVFVVGSTSQIILVCGGIASMVADIKVESFHSIIR